MKSSPLKTLIVALTLTGCASAPTQYLTLMPPPGRPTAPAAAQVPAALQTSGDSPVVGADPAAFVHVPTVSVTVPSQVDQSELVVRQSDGSMALLQSVRWIAPLGDEIRTALALSLAEQWAALPAMRVNVDVQRFDSMLGQYAYIEAAWTLTLPGTPIQKISGRSAIKIPVREGYAALAAGHRQAIEALAAQILDKARTAGAAAP
jgi:uncharacterized lipoprotein YmbA